jgi:transcriptional regulator with XRE-family HTH domain
MTAAEFHEARKSLGLNQAELAALFGWRAEHVSRVEAGKKAVTPLAAFAMRALLAGHR